MELGWNKLSLLTDNTPFDRNLEKRRLFRSQNYKHTAKHFQSNNQFSILILNGAKNLEISFSFAHVIH